MYSPDMKPTLQFLTTDHNFQASSGDFFGRCSGGGRGGPSFRQISSDYLNRESRGHFAGEAALFAVIIFIAAIPIVQGIRSALAFARATGVF